MTVLLWLLTFINFVVLGYLFKKVDNIMGANKDELSRVKNDLNVAIDNVVKKIADLKAGIDVVTPAEIRAAVAEPLARLVDLGKVDDPAPPPVEPPVEPPIPSVDPAPSSSFRRNR